jgi:predicted kinase
METNYNINPENNCLIVLVGLPRSGKSTFRKSLTTQFGWPTICPDDFRYLIHGAAFKPEFEKKVWETVHLTIKELFLTGSKNVILDATNISLSDRNQFKNPELYLRRIYYFTTPKNICIQRAKDTNQEYLMPIIEKMSLKYVIPDLTELSKGEVIYHVDSDNHLNLIQE